MRLVGCPGSSSYCSQGHQKIYPQGSAPILQENWCEYLPLNKKIFEFPCLTNLECFLIVALRSYPGQNFGALSFSRPLEPAAHFLWEVELCSQNWFSWIFEITPRGMAWLHFLISTRPASSYSRLTSQMFSKFEKFPPISKMGNFWIKARKSSLFEQRWHSRGCQELNFCFSSRPDFLVEPGWISIIGSPHFQTWNSEMGPRGQVWKNWRSDLDQVQRRQPNHSGRVCNAPRGLLGTSCD